MWGTLLVLFSSCGDNGLTVFNTDPEVVITAPAQGEAFAEGHPVIFEARVTDDQTPLADLDLAWSTPAGPLVGTSTLTDDTVTHVVENLPTGALDVTLTAIDPDGAAGEDSVSIVVFRNAPPTVAIVTPADATQLLLGDPIAVRVEVDDDRDPPEDLALSWGGVAAGLGPARANGDGVASFQLVDLPVGGHTLEVTVTDSLGDTASASVGFLVTDGDLDDDGFLAIVAGGNDCDDGDATVHPGAEETCNGLDDDCNGSIDEPNPTAPLWYLDDDGDTFGDPNAPTRACDRPADHVANDDDCNDALASVNPDATEVCNGRDDNCADGEDDAIDKPTWFLDDDGDTFGDPTTGVQACAPPTADHVGNDLDCNDDADRAFPGGTEICDGLDNNCVDGVDEDNPSAPVRYRDADNDTWGDPDTTRRACTLPDGFVDRGRDCDDALPDVHPDAPESCNDRDDDCDGALDEDPVDPTTWYRDVDTDGYGNPNRSRQDCDRPAGWVADNTDCNDAVFAINPGTDADEDTFHACEDCDDDDPWVYPGAAEICDRKDSDCDGVIPEDETTNDDDDLFVACEDCNDEDDTVFPGAQESCNAVDDDCSGRVDDGVGTCDCPVYTDSAGRTYLFCEGGLNWGEAFAYCDALGYELLSVSAPVQNTFIRDIVASFPWQEPTTGQDADDAWWTGGSRPIRSGADCAPAGDPVGWPWEWADGTGWTNPNWRFGEPNNLTGCEGCVEVWFDGGWNDEDCGALRNWICELDPPPAAR